ncbi:uncharacterized protein EDB91DRAFT_1107725 [Suillus paluster]|uniref:uncharacterized protein n=1 Tax=Suillus paluster TaxID=48578 RepID=UPI001B875A86|nr:uncharacterized protein EDB91DRAFT_1107725 [Suillus paluster]KAG1750491.1 hypothetical protein EDB91DRAFT_1107725 [Suillus paluster]
MAHSYSFNSEKNLYTCGPSALLSVGSYFISVIKAEYKGSWSTTFLTRFRALPPSHSLEWTHSIFFIPLYSRQTSCLSQTLSQNYILAFLSTRTHHIGAPALIASFRDRYCMLTIQCNYLFCFFIRLLKLTLFIPTRLLALATQCILHHHCSDTTYLLFAFVTSLTFEFAFLVVHIFIRLWNLERSVALLFQNKWAARGGPLSSLWACCGSSAAAGLGSITTFIDTYTCCTYQYKYAKYTSINFSINKVGAQ